MFRLEIKTGGSAFRDALTGDECSLSEAQEIVRILGEVKKQLESDMTKGSVRDYNGNTVGSWKR